MTSENVKINEATGEVTLTLDSTAFVLHATLPRMADLQATLGVPGLRLLSGMITTADARIVYHGLRCLVSEDQRAAVDKLTFAKCSGDVIDAVAAAIAGGLPEPEDDDAGKGGAAA